MHGDLFHALQFKYINHVRQGLPHWVTDSLHRDKSEESPMFQQSSQTPRVLIGIFTTTSEIARQAQWRSLLKGRIVQSGDVLAHGLNFILVEGLVVPHQAYESGKIVLDLPENMNSGKSVAWFRAAFERFETADYIAKMDSDTYICPSILESSFVRAHSAQASYVGHISECGGFSHCPKNWSYMSGGFHSISRSTVAKIIHTQRGRPAVVHDFEDMNTGYWVHEVHVSDRDEHTFELSAGSVEWNGGDEASAKFLCESMA
eukprot:CAMPEP_0179709232 /NCGR_PEP_ID=MMETSP0937-20121108/5782_1 /TAXON_ID=548131 ORGANISM="Ostreococcus mediterraneus, Strain clade-D-RCC2593" /NCGR_SAMPLE_ID=MMETSP0937 /ASSEMBLY_ACC=CAM_ASM_000575 /LENGTH=259 /DNA_ID=CAMNT_0021582581 /DNA_START=1082 /DNA_END=1861 /DNA_ORIENTATION=-